MSDPPRGAPNNQLAFCRTCKEDFLVYAAAGRPECPRCGGPAYLLRHRKMWSLIGIVILIVGTGAAVCAYWFWK
jgi:hypothetical protein